MATVDSTTAADPTDEEEGEPLELPHRRGLSRLTLALAAAAVGAAVFLAGVEVEKHWGAQGASAQTGSGLGRLGDRFGRSGAGGGRGALGGLFGGGATVGTVGVIKGDVLYVTDTSGNTVRVLVPSGVAVETTVTATSKAIHPGDTVVVRGTTAANGDVQAQSVTVSAGGAAGFGGGGSGGATGFGGNGNGAGSGSGGG